MDEKQLKQELKKRDDEIATLKKAICMLEQHIKKLTVGYNRNTENIRMVKGEVAKITEVVRRIK